MGKLSLEAKIMRGLATFAIGASLLGGARAPKKCKGGEIYPPDGDELPSRASYFIEVPKVDGCGIQIYLDEYKDIYLLVYTDRMEFIVWDNKVNVYTASAMPLPDNAGVVNFSWGDILGSVVRIGDTYRINYNIQPDYQLPIATPESIEG